MTPKRISRKNSKFVFRTRSLILNELKENPEISCRQIARQTKIPYSTVNYTLTHRLNYKSVHTQYAPHILNEEDKMIKIQCRKEILIILKKCQKKSYRSHNHRR